MLKQLMWLINNPNIMDKYKNIETIKNKLKYENQTLNLKLYRFTKLMQKYKSYNDSYKIKYNELNIKYSELNSEIKKIKKINDLKGNIDIAYEIKNKLNMYKDTYYSKNPILSDIDTNNMANKNKSDYNMVHYNFDFSIQNPMKYSKYTLRGFNRIQNSTHLLKGYLRRLRTKNYDKFKKLLFNTPKYPTNIFYYYMNIVKKKEKEIEIEKYNDYDNFSYKYLFSDSQKIDCTSSNQNSYFVSISLDIFYKKNLSYNFRYIFNAEKSIIVFEVIRRMLLNIDTNSNNILRNKILEIIKNTKFRITPNKYITYPFYDGNNPNDYIVHDTKHRINLNKAYVPYNKSEIEKEMKYIDKLTGNQFESYISNLLKKLGYEKVQTTQASNDYGLDNIGYNRDIKYGFQCKHYKSSVGYRAISEVASGCKIYNAKHGIVVTNNLFSKNAIKAANNMNIILWDRETLKNKIMDSGK